MGRLFRTMGRYALHALVCVLFVSVISDGSSGVAQAAQGNQGLQGGWAVDDAGNVLFDKSVVDTLPFMQEAGAGWVRINFRLGDCFQDWETSVCMGRTALEAYDAVITEAQNRNLKVLGLLSNESWHGQQSDWTANAAETTAGGSGDNAYIRDFAEKAARVLAAHFGERVPHWEVWNEPNAWTSLDANGEPTGGTFIYPSNFAWLLKRSYDAIKSADPNAAVISGGLFGHDIGGASVTIMERGQPRQAIKRGDFAPARVPGRPPSGDTSPCPSTLTNGGDYLCATYDAGIAKAKWQKGRYPLDHIGQHLYVDQGGATSAAKLSSYLDDLRNAYLKYEGKRTTKQTHLTEFGWQTPTGGLSEATQAANLQVAYDTFKKTTYVARAYWFAIQDVPAALLYFGLLRDDGSQKPAFATYQTAAAY